MKRDSRLSVCLHVLLHMAENGKPITSEVLAPCLHTNPVVIRRTMAGLRNSSLVNSEKGHGGGWLIAKELSEISLKDIYEALGEPILLTQDLSSGNPHCLVSQVVNESLGTSFEKARRVLINSFSQVTLADLALAFGKESKKLRSNPRRMRHG